MQDRSHDLDHMECVFHGVHRAPLGLEGKISTSIACNFLQPGSYNIRVSSIIFVVTKGKGSVYTFLIVFRAEIGRYFYLYYLFTCVSSLGHRTYTCYVMF